MSLTANSPRSRAGLATVMIAALSLAATAPVLAQEDNTDQNEDMSAETTDETTDEMSKGEKRLAKMLEGRVPGEPLNCIRTMPTGQIVTIDDTAYVFGRGNTIYVQRTLRPNQINDRDALVMRRFGSGTQLCRQDIARTVDPVTGIFTGAVQFQDFVPYTRVKDGEG